MPLAHTPYKPKPILELLKISRISAKDALRGIEASLAKSSLEPLDPLEGGAAVTAPADHQVNLSLVNFRQIPNIRDALKRDWMDPSSASQEAVDCFVEVRGRLEVHMHPCFMGERLAVGLREAAGALLIQWSPTLKCAPLAFTELKPAGSHAAIVGESPYVHFYAAFTAVGFAPKIGHQLPGRVNLEQTPHGVNIKILSAFNMFVHKKGLPAGVEWDRASGSASWVYNEPNGSGAVSSQRLGATNSGPAWTKVASISENPFSFKGTLAEPFNNAALPTAIPAKKDSSSRASAASSNTPAPAGGQTPDLQRRIETLREKKIASFNLWKSLPGGDGAAAEAAKLTGIKAEIKEVKRQIDELAASVAEAETSPKKKKKKVTA